MFLDEIGEMLPATQVKLLRVLQERKVKPVGSTAEVPFEARLLAATNKRLDEEVRTGRFREDLFYPDATRRLHTNPLRILDSKNPAMQDLIAAAPKLMDELEEDALRHFDEVQAILKRHDVPFEINPRLVRGLDYYNRTVFEWVTTSLGAQGTICAGGVTLYASSPQ